MPLVEKMSSETELRDQIARLDHLATNNTATAKDFLSRRDAAQRELNTLLMSRPGHEIVKTADVQAAITAAAKAGYEAGHDAATAELKAAATATADAAVEPPVEAAS